MRRLFLNTEDAAEFLNISKRKLVKMTARGELPYFKHGRLFFYKSEELIGFIQPKFNVQKTYEIDPSEIMSIPPLAA